MSNDRLAAQAEALMALLDNHELGELVNECVAPFVDKLRATLPQDQLNADNLALSYVTFEQLGNRLPEVFGTDALQQFIEFRQSAPACLPVPGNRSRATTARKDEQRVPEACILQPPPGTIHSINVYLC